MKVGKTPYVRFDLNDYSVPPTHVQRTLTVVADPQQVRIVDGQTVLARTAQLRPWGSTSRMPAHIADPGRSRSAAARHHRGTDRLTQAVPDSRELLVQAAERGANLGSDHRRAAAAARSLWGERVAGRHRGGAGARVPHPNAVRLALERRREAPPPAATGGDHLPEHVHSRDTPVRPHRLDPYDQLTEDDDDEPP